MSSAWSYIRPNPDNPEEMMWMGRPSAWKPSHLSDQMEGVHARSPEPVTRQYPPHQLGAFASHAGGNARFLKVSPGSGEVTGVSGVDFHMGWLEK